MEGRITDNVDIESVKVRDDIESVKVIVDIESVKVRDGVNHSQTHSIVGNGPLGA